MITKKAYIYLPYNYKSNVKYNILYLMHGGAGAASTFMGTEASPTKLKPIIDHMIESKVTPPLLIVLPEIKADVNDFIDGPASFPKELINDLLPKIESKYLPETDSTDLTASRRQRAFGGFSAGSSTTWNVLCEALDYFTYFLPMSGVSWAAMPDMNSAFPSDKTAEHIYNAVKKFGYTPKDYYIYAVTGTTDFTESYYSYQIEYMKSYTDAFIYTTDDFTKGNLIYNVIENNTHEYQYAYEYIYNALPLFFK